MGNMYRCDVFLFFFNLTFCKVAFSLVTSNVRLVRHEPPMIVTVDNLLSEDELLLANNLLANEAITETSDYQEDVFSNGAEAGENDHFNFVVAKTGLSVPVEYQDSPLKSFVWAVTNCPELMEEQDIIKGANAIQRRQAIERWKTKEGQLLMELSADEESFKKAGQRLVMPPKLRLDLENLVLPRVLDSLQANWDVCDATIVRYSQGESQVPHIDPCDATLLLYLNSDDCIGGDTCFPLVDCKLSPQDGGGVLFFSSESPRHLNGEISRERECLSLHHGGQVQRGEKVVAQFMLNVQLKKPVETWLDLVSCLPK